jgi:hypothetical protein
MTSTYLPIGVGCAPLLWKAAAEILEVKASTSVHHARVPDTKKDEFFCGEPAVSVTDYLRRLSKYCDCSEECYPIMLVLIDRWVHATQTPLTPYNVHRIMLAALLVAIKLQDDIYYSDRYYAKVAGITTEDRNTLEAAFLKAIQWKLFVEAHVYNRVYKGLSEMRKSKPLTSRSVPPLRCTLHSGR